MQTSPWRSLIAIFMTAVLLGGCGGSSSDSADTGAEETSNPVTAVEDTDGQPEDGGDMAGGEGGSGGKLAANISLMLFPSSGDVYLSWSYESDTEIAKQEIYREPVSGVEGNRRIATLDAAQRTYIDEDIGSGYYRYWVRLSSPENATALSNPAATNNPHAMAGELDGACFAGAILENTTVDCGGVTLGLSCDGDGESQPPVLTLRNATVKNVRLAASGGSDGIHCEGGDCVLENVIWEDICEDAATNRGDSLTIFGGVAYNSSDGYGGKPDKVLQHNSKGSSTIVKGNFVLTGSHGKLYRSCGNCPNNGGPRFLDIESATIKADIGNVAGVNANYGDVASIRNLKIKDYESGNPKVCVEYKGAQSGSSSTKIGEAWESAACDVRTGDVSSF